MIEANSSAKISLEIESPFGPLCLTEQHGAIVSLLWESPAISRSTALLAEAQTQMRAYFSGKLKKFDLPLKPAGDPFQQSVCNAMLEIPYGETSTYGAIAKVLNTYGQPVGNACGANTIPIIIPCHRVLAVNGLGGYSGDGGVERKIELLKLEGGFPYLL
ncbi:MAG: cysteine methyltransferase [Hyphomicrobiales bacterium]|nr:MAG: cysteine methyltransferase [Hyphomicrobiales bacterium]